MGRRREVDRVDGKRTSEGVTTRLKARTPDRQTALEAARSSRRIPNRSEDILWQALRGRLIDGAKFRRQHPLGGFIVDFYCPQHRLVVEVDGGVHADQTDRDLARQRALEVSGYRFLRVAAEDVETNLPAVLTRIHTAICANPIGNEDL